LSAKLYALKLSPPVHAARLMLGHKRIDHDVVNLVPGLIPRPCERSRPATGDRAANVR
jgi:hypothetical protein